MPTTAPRAAKPTKEIFDPFNSSATGHQRAENRLSGSTLWRDSRHRKLREQFTSGGGGGKRVADTVGGGAVGELKMGLEESGKITWFREQDQLSLQETLKVTKEVERPAKRVKLDQSVDGFPTAQHTAVRTPAVKQKTSPDPSPSEYLSPIDPNTSFATTSSTSHPSSRDRPPSPPQNAALPQIFANQTIYINGSTAPAISDHKLKHLLTTHGANISIALGRRRVTHVIIGRPNSNGGSGGGLAGTKIHKEIVAKRGECVKYVTVEWVLESVKAGKRLPEREFEALRLAPKGVGSVADVFGGWQKGKKSTAGDVRI